MRLTLVITGAYFGALLLTIYAHTFKAGTKANRDVLFALVIVLAILTIHGV